MLGLEMGADDYVVKPFSLKELRRARQGGAAPRDGGEAPRGYRDENWEIEFDAYVVRYRRRGDPAHAQGVRAVPLHGRAAGRAS